VCSLRGRLLADEDYDNREQPTAAKQQGNVVAAPDAGRYLGVKGAHRGSETRLAKSWARKYLPANNSARS
jgi:hypothetical protein